MHPSMSRSFHRLAAILPRQGCEPGQIHALVAADAAHRRPTTDSPDPQEALKATSRHRARPTRRYSLARSRAEGAPYGHPCVLPMRCPFSCGPVHRVPSNPFPRSTTPFLFKVKSLQPFPRLAPSSPSPSPSSSSEYIGPSPRLDPPFRLLSTAGRIHPGRPHPAHATHFSIPLLATGIEWGL
jgi:hypothetical protein